MTNQRIDWDKLRVFKVVAELGSMTSAAARLRESPPTVSRKIDELEEFLSSKLFTRSTRGMELTETGKTVLRYARQMEESANEVLSKAIGKTEPFLDPAQQQHAAVGRQPAAVEPGAQFFVLNG